MITSLFKLRPAMVAMTVVTLILGFLIVAQLRTQSSGSPLDSLTANDLTTLIGNLNTRNEGLRDQVAALRTQLADLNTSGSSTTTTLDQLDTSIDRVRAWSGAAAATGPGVRIMVRGAISGTGIEDLLNELRNAGAEALAVGGVRIVAGTVVAGPAGGISVDNTPLRNPVEILVIGNPEAITGSLTRAGGIIAQLSATYPGTDFVVEPAGSLTVPATKQSLSPSHGSPKL